MAYLLGSQFCIESLRSDVSDLQEAVTDVISRAGPVRCPSWKYPDKQALDINIAELLYQHSYSEDEEERQVSHIVLLELVIDRLVLLLQTMSGYLDQILAMNHNAGSAVSGQSNSVGLAVKKYWNKLVHVFTVAQQLQSENKSRSRKIADLENTIKKLNSENGRSMQAGSVKDLPLSPEAVDLLTKSGLLDAIGSPSPPRPKDISHDEYNKSTQTLETAFIPCESCHEVQKNLQRVGDTVIAICQNEGLPCALVKYREQVEALDWLSANDVSRWTSEQNKDLERIQKHLRQLYETIDPLKKDLAEAETKRKSAEEKAAECKKQMKLEQQTLRTQQKQFQGKMEEIKLESKEALDVANKQKEEIIANKKKLEEQLAALQEEMEKQKECLSELESTKSNLEEKLTENQTTEEKVSHLEKDVEILNEKLNGVNKELREVNKELSKEKAKARSFTRHQESVQGKQEHLVKRIDELDTENAELQDKVAELEDQQEQLKEEKEKLQDALNRANDNCKDATDHLKEQKRLLKKMEEEKHAVEDSMKELEDAMNQMNRQLQEAKERERLIVEYPDLNGPVNPDISGTGDIAQDMENQVRANSTRIQILEDQNSGLRKAIGKMLHSQSSPPKPPKEPMQLWQNTQMEMPQQRSPPDGSPPERPEHNGELYAYRSPPAAPSSQNRRMPPQVLQNNFVVSPPPGSAGRTRTRSRLPSGNSPKQRPSSGINQKGQSDQSINMYIKLKNAGLVNKPNSAEMRYLLDRGKHPYKHEEQNDEREMNSADGNNYARDVVICEKCDKMYKNKEDLEIHKSYCFGNI